MKKMMFTILTGLMAVVLVACGGNEESKEANNDSSKTAQTDQQKDQQKQMDEMQKKLEAQKIDEKKTVAIVNDKEILGSDYNIALAFTQQQMQQMGQDPTSKEAAEQVKNQTIDGLVGQTVLLQAADKYKASEEDINKQLEELKKQYKTEEEFEAALKQSGMDMKTLETRIANDIKISQYIQKEVPAGEVTDEEIQRTYDQFAEQGKSTGQEVPKLEELKPQIVQSLQQQKQQEKLALQVEELKKNAKIDIKI